MVMASVARRFSITRWHLLSPAFFDRLVPVKRVILLLGTLAQHTAARLDQISLWLSLQLRLLLPSTSACGRLLLRRVVVLSVVRL